MTTPFEIDANTLTRLDQYQLTNLLRDLLHHEAARAGIALGDIDVPANITVSDGGEDGRVEWTDGPSFTNYLPSRLVQFQCKATDMGPTDCAKELVTRDGTLKPMVACALDKGATYVLFNNRALNPSQCKKRIGSIRQKLRDLGNLRADSVEIRIYDAAKIAAWVNQFIASVIKVAEWSGQPIIPGALTWDEWRRCEQERLAYVPDTERDRAAHVLARALARPKSVVRLIGLSGLGKTRLALEAFRARKGEEILSQRVVYVDAWQDILNRPGYRGGPLV